MACGHCLAAVLNGMAECTPNLRASYDAAETTPRSSRCPPTTTALPISSGLNSSSTETKKASISTWKIVVVKVSMGAATRFYQGGRGRDSALKASTTKGTKVHEGGLVDPGCCAWVMNLAGQISFIV